MRPVIYACLAVTLYAVTNVVIEQKLSKIHQIPILLCSYPLMLVLALAWFGKMSVNGDNATIPSGWLLLIILGNAAVWFMADFLFIGAFSEGGSLFTITTIIMMFPVVAAIVKFA